MKSKFLLITPDRCLIFPSAEYVRNLINKQGIKQNIPVVIDCTHIYGADYTSAKVVETLIEDFQRRNQVILFFNLKTSVVSIFDGVKFNFKVFYDFDLLEKVIDDLQTSYSP
jgi:solute carrier family 26 (sodium-independent sulfate anion transporter), member 11